MSARGALTTATLIRRASIRTGRFRAPAPPTLLVTGTRGRVGQDATLTRATTRPVVWAPALTLTGRMPKALPGGCVRATLGRGTVQTLRRVMFASSTMRAQSTLADRI